MKKVLLQFDVGTIEAELRDSPIADSLYSLLPLSIDLLTWGDEAYGTIAEDLGEDRPVSEIHGGGIAYTNNGNYLCFFYGQQPAWAVEWVGQMEDGWEILKKKAPGSVRIKRVN